MLRLRSKNIRTLSSWPKLDSLPNLFTVSDSEKVELLEKGQSYVESLPEIFSPVIKTVGEQFAASGIDSGHAMFIAGACAMVVNHQFNRAMTKDSFAPQSTAEEKLFTREVMGLSTSKQIVRVRLETKPYLNYLNSQIESLKGRSHNEKVKLLSVYTNRESKIHHKKYLNYRVVLQKCRKNG